LISQSRGLGDVYKRQGLRIAALAFNYHLPGWKKSAS
jgi:hypothetical protein